MYSAPILHNMIRLCNFAIKFFDFLSKLYNNTCVHLTDPADCGIPVIVNGSVNYTTTVAESTATYQCGTGLIPVGVITAVCMRNGKWVPDPAEVGCRPPGNVDMRY